MTALGYLSKLAAAQHDSRKCCICASVNRMSHSANILILEPFYTGSHAAWLDGLRRHSSHQISALTLPGQWWQWRMQGGAVSLARLFMASDLSPNLILASDMLDLTTFLSLTRQRTAAVKTAVYFHENQLTYPPGPRIKRDLKLGFINYASALAADRVFFNSNFHRSAFMDELPRLLKHYPDYWELETVAAIHAKSEVLPVGVDLARFDEFATPKDYSQPVILWNHRWEADKDTETFMKAMLKLAAQGHAFALILAGEKVGQAETPIDHLAAQLPERVLHIGYAPDFASYARLLWRATHVVSTAYQDFFGISMVEAIYCGALPLMPRRLNYPDLLPTDQHGTCLYLEGGLAAALTQHLYTPAPPALRQYVRQFDWRQIIGQYDRRLNAVIQGE
ncbi:MAG: DUF3524 domain-containing protein [Anaerolineae bacterium]